MCNVVKLHVAQLTRSASSATAAGEGWAAVHARPTLCNMQHSTASSCVACAQVDEPWYESRAVFNTTSAESREGSGDWGSCCGACGRGRIWAGADAEYAMAARRQRVWCEDGVNCQLLGSQERLDAAVRGSAAHALRHAPKFGQPGLAAPLCAAANPPQMTSIAAP